MFGGGCWKGEHDPEKKFWVVFGVKGLWEKGEGVEEFCNKASVQNWSEKFQWNTVSSELADLVKSEGNTESGQISQKLCGSPSCFLPPCLPRMLEVSSVGWGPKVGRVCSSGQVLSQATMQQPGVHSLSLRISECLDFVPNSNKVKLQNTEILWNRMIFFCLAL